jgi:hypothetical protein
LASAYASAGESTRALDTAEQALALSRAAQDPELTNQILQLIEQLRN